MIRRDGIIDSKKDCRLHIKLNWHEDKKIITFMISLLMIVSSFNMFFVYLATAIDVDGPLQRTCFPAGTKITMADGSLKNIEDIRVGDKILSFDVKNKKFIVTTVIRLHRPIREGVYDINDGLIKPTRDHPFYVEKPDGRRGWASIDPEMTKWVYPSLAEIIMPLEIGDKIYTQKGEWIRVYSIVYIPGLIQTYTFNVDAEDKVDANNYFANGLLAHNACCDPLSCSGTHCDSWTYYCDGDTLKKKRTCITFECLSGSCVGNADTEVQTVANCNNNDGYYDTGDTRVTTPSLSVSPSTIYVGSTLSGSGSGSVRQKKQIYRNYYCSGGSCVYTTGSTRWVDDLAYKVTYEYKFYNVNDNAIRQDWSSDNSYIVQQVDAHNTIRVYVRAVSSGDYSSTTYVDIPVANSAPVIESIPDKSVNEGEILTFDMNYNDADGDSVTWSWTGIGLIVNGDDYYLCKVPDSNHTDDNYTVTISVDDGYGGSDSESFQVTVIDVNQDPSIDSLTASSLTINATENITFTSSVSDPENDVIDYIWHIYNESGSELNSLTPMNEPTLEYQFKIPGKYKVSLTVSDNFGSSSSMTLDSTITVKQVIACNKETNLIVWHAETISAKNLSAKLGLRGNGDPDTSDQIAVLNKTTARWSLTWTVNAPGDDFTIQPDDIMRIELNNATSQSTGVTTDVSGCDDFSTEITLYRDNNINKGGSNYIPWVCENDTWTADKLAQSLGLATGQVIAKYDPVEGKWNTAYIYGVTPSTSSFNFEIHPGDIIYIKVDPNTAGTKIRLRYKEIEIIQQ